MARCRQGRTRFAVLLALAVPSMGAAQEIAVDPTAILLDGPEATHSLLVSTISSSGVRIDLTHKARYRTLTPQTVAVSPSGVVRGVTDGAGLVQVEIFEATYNVEVTIRGSTTPRSFHFEHDIEPILAKSGCNSSGCHGKAEGQNGFKLSVFGFDPDGDYDAIVKEARGRRVTPAAPEQSLLVRKAIGAVPHGGGQRVRPQSWSHRTLSDWVRAGFPRGGANAPSVAEIRMTPRQAQMRSSSRQQLRVVARYTDGRQIDVTQIAQFQSNNEGLASVDASGLVTTGKVPGQAAVMATFSGAVDVFRVLIPRDERIENYPDLPQYNFIDGLVYAHLETLNILPSDETDDAEFLRRAYLDIIGTLPTASETRRFLSVSGESRERRARLVDELLERPEYATYWALKWSDLLRIDRQSLGHKAAYSYYRWLLRGFAENKPIALIARELLTVEGPLTESSQGYFFKVASSPGSAASAVSQTLLGVRIECAQCHHHPFDRWSQTDYHGMAGFFTQVKWKGSPRGESLVVEGSPDVKHPRTGKVVSAHPLGAPVPERSPAGDRRVALADWMTSTDNPWFARNVANRLWAEFMGRGIVDPVDDVRATNPPTNPALLDALARHLVEKQFDLKELIRAITGSRIYQLSSQPNPTNVDDEQNYSRALLRRMNAEVLFDAVCQVTGVEEKFHGVASGHRAIELWDNKVPHYFLQLFGRPIRQSVCVCERNSEPTPAQVLHFLNSESIHRKIQHEAGTVARLVESIASNRDLVDQLYVTFFSRFPTEAERDVCVKYFETFAAREQGRREAAEDLAWSLLNSLEFIFNH